jgi:hypothetical protein
MFEIVETMDEWIVRQAGDEIARFDTEASAMNAVAERMRERPSDEPVSFSIRFSGRSR